MKKIFTKYILKILKENSKKKFFTRDNFSNSDYCIGEFSYGLPLVLNWGDGSKLRIGKFCSISDNVTILLGGNHRVDWVSTFPFNALSNYFPNAKNSKGHSYSKGDVNIGNDVWIGRGATILSGVTIGDGAVIGAKCVVAKDVSPYSIMVGNPGRLIKKRFSEEDIEKLVSIQWWSWPHERINEHIQLIMSSDIDSLVKLKF